MAAPSVPASQVFDSLDKNNDGVVTREEFEEGVRSMMMSAPQVPGQQQVAGTVMLGGSGGSMAPGGQYGTSAVATPPGSMSVPATGLPPTYGMALASGNANVNYRQWPSGQAGANPFGSSAADYSHPFGSSTSVGPNSARPLVPGSMAAPPIPSYPAIASHQIPQLGAAAGGSQQFASMPALPGSGLLTQAPPGTSTFANSMPPGVAAGGAPVGMPAGSAMCSGGPYASSAGGRVPGSMALGGGLQTGAAGGLPGSMPIGGCGAPASMPCGFPGTLAGVPGSMPMGGPGGCPAAGIAGGSPCGVPGAMPAGAAGGFPAGAPGSIPMGGMGGFPAGAPGSMPMGGAGGFPTGGLPGSMPMGGPGAGAAGFTSGAAYGGGIGGPGAGYGGVGGPQTYGAAAAAAGAPNGYGPGAGAGMLGRPAAAQNPAFELEPDYYEQVTEVPKVSVEIVEKLVEVPEPQVVDRIIEVPQVQEVVTEIPGEVDVRLVTREVPKIEVKQVERVVEVPEVHYQDRFVEVPMVQEVVRRVPRIEVREIPIERIIQVPKKVVQEIVQPVYRPVPHLVKQPVERTIPVPKVTMQQMEVVTQEPQLQGGLMDVHSPAQVDWAAAAHQLDGASARLLFENLDEEGKKALAEELQKAMAEGRLAMPLPPGPQTGSAAAPAAAAPPNAVQPLIVGSLPSIQAQSVYVPMSQMAFQQQAAVNAFSQRAAPAAQVTVAAPAAQVLASHAQVTPGQVLNLQGAPTITYGTPPTPPLGSMAAVPIAPACGTSTFASPVVQQTVMPYAAVQRTEPYPSYANGAVMMSTGGPPTPPVPLRSGVQAVSAANIFDALDQDHDGVITREEFNRAASTMAPIGVA